jgi:hypothetical protein
LHSRPLFLLLISLTTSCVAITEDPGLVADLIRGGTGGAGSGSGSVGTGGDTVFGTGGALGSGGNLGAGGSGVNPSTGGASGAPDAGQGTAGRIGGPDGGMPAGSGGVRAGSGGVMGSGGVAGPVAAVCTSKVNWNGSSNANMRPGQSCRGCHSYPISGTIYPTLHEPTNCNGLNGSTGVRIVITGANGTTMTLTPNSAGNFFSNSAPSTPFTVRVTSSAGTRAMMAAQNSGDCNSCHSQNGTNGASGRVTAP